MSARRAGRVVLLLAVLAGALPLAGCWDRTEINDLGLITGAAIDRYNSKLIQLSVQIFIPRASGGGGGAGSGGGGGSMEMKGGGNSNTFVLSAVGENIADALSHMQERLPRKLFWGHAEVIIFGEEQARYGIGDDVDYLMRAPQPRERAYIYVCEGKARKALEMQAVLERDSSEALREIAKSKLSMSVTMTDLAQMLTSDSGAAALPWLRMNPPRSKRNPDTSANYTNGTAIFKGDKLIGVVDAATTRGILWLRNEIRMGVVTVTPEKSRGTVSAKLLRSKTRLYPHIQGNKWSMTVRIKSETEALQNASSANLLTSEGDIELVEEAMDADMIGRVEQALRKVQKGLKADVFDFAGEFHRAYPKEWHRNKDRWDEIFPEVDVKVDPTSQLLRPGLTNVQSTTRNAEEQKRATKAGEEQGDGEKEGEDAE
ncbi:spore germination protein KC [Paenibacillus sp. UNC496MF]|uniref:Ger(x)C family spore germination protein n=1 Tax=Paenibacillus sp. UNC496MF TaxID=1502753 RepID=UPI0008F0A472|nr:Ger(x)C family spore germination protein [Paenibacillus sp. UNC496MF]SFI99049.1 spore germination protein KC [Paenibacillus sp. UNC496MF]